MRKGSINPVLDRIERGQHHDNGRRHKLQQSIITTASPIAHAINILTPLPPSLSFGSCDIGILLNVVLYSRGGGEKGKRRAQGGATDTYSASLRGAQ